MPDTARELIEQLAILDENVLAEAARQPQQFMRVARYRVSKMRKRSQAVAAVEYQRYRKALAIRAAKNSEGEKITEGAIKERVELSSRTQALRDVMERSFAEEELAKLLLEAYRIRRDSIRIIAEAQVYEASRETAEIEKVTARQKLAAEARKLNRVRAGIEADE